MAPTQHSFEQSRKIRQLIQRKLALPFDDDTLGFGVGKDAQMHHDETLPATETNLAVLFVCLGNICRSPSAEAVLRATSKLSPQQLKVDSAGLGNWHVGKPPERMAIDEGARRGYDLSTIRARHFDLKDYERFDVIVAMTSGYRRSLRDSAPPSRADRVVLFGAFGGRDADVADPYHGTVHDFAAMFDVLETGMPHLDRHLVRAYEAKSAATTK